MKKTDKDLVIVAFAVIDTNVIVASMLGNRPSATKDIMSYVDNGNIIPVFDERVTDEYYEVLNRFFTEDIVIQKLGTIINSGILVKDVEKTKEFFKDKKDIPFFEVKEAATELDPYLITGNTKDFPEGTTRTPAFVVDVLQYLNNFIVKDIKHYLEEINKTISELSKEKYTLGSESDLLDSYIEVSENITDYNDRNKKVDCR